MTASSEDKPAPEPQRDPVPRQSPAPIRSERDALDAARRPDPASAAFTQLAPGVRVPSAALSLTFSRAGGPGGQNVNKTSTRAQLSADMGKLGLPRDVLARLADLAGSRATTDGRIVIASGVHRSQRLNADECQRRLAQLIQKARTRPKTRRATKPTAGSKRRRIEGKKRRGDLKRSRRRPSDD